MPMTRIEDPQRAFASTQSIEMRKFWETYPPKILRRPGAARTLTAKQASGRSLKFNNQFNSMYFGVVG